MITRQGLQRYVQPPLDDVLQRAGFERGQDDIWRRFEGEVLDCVEIQTKSDRKAFCVELGVHFAFIPIAAGAEAPNLPVLTAAQCELRSRLERGGQEVWWSDPMADAQDLANLVKTYGLEFFGRYADIRTAFGAISPDTVDGDQAMRLTPNLTRARRLLFFALVHEHLGNLEWAETIAELGLQGNLPTGPKVQLKRLTARLSIR